IIAKYPEAGPAEAPPTMARLQSSKACKDWAVERLGSVGQPREEQEARQSCESAALGKDNKRSSFAARSSKDLGAFPALSRTRRISSHNSVWGSSSPSEFAFWRACSRSVQSARSSCWC